MDLKSIISDLSARGLSQTEIAHRCGCKQPTISELASGKTRNPGFQIGLALVDLHKKTKPRQSVKPA